MQIITTETILNELKGISFGEFLIKPNDRIYEPSKDEIFLEAQLKFGIKLKDHVFINKMSEQQIRNLCFVDASVILISLLIYFEKFDEYNRQSKNEYELFYFVVDLFYIELCDNSILDTKIKPWYKKGFLSKSSYQKSKIKYTWSLLIFGSLLPIYRCDSHSPYLFIGSLEGDMQKHESLKKAYQIFLLSNKTHNCIPLDTTTFQMEGYINTVSQMIRNMDSSHKGSKQTKALFTDLQTKESIIVDFEVKNKTLDQYQEELKRMIDGKSEAYEVENQMDYFKIMNGLFQVSE